MSVERERAISTRAYPSGRCRAIVLSDRRRCRNPSGRGQPETLCTKHAAEDDPVTIDSDPRTLLQAVSESFPAQCRAIQHDSNRCETGCGPTDRFCALHETIAVSEVTDTLDDGELDTVLIKQALSAVEQDRAMTDGGLDYVCENCGARYYGDTAAETCCLPDDEEVSP